MSRNTLKRHECLIAKISANNLSYPPLIGVEGRLQRVSSKINGFPLKDCGNDVTCIMAIKH